MTSLQLFPSVKDVTRRLSYLSTPLRVAHLYDECSLVGNQRFPGPTLAFGSENRGSPSWPLKGPVRPSWPTESSRSAVPAARGVQRAIHDFKSRSHRARTAANPHRALPSIESATPVAGDPCVLPRRVVARGYPKSSIPSRRPSAKPPLSAIPQVLLALCVDSSQDHEVRRRPT